jgi:hypothetical protein
LPLVGHGRCHSLVYFSLRDTANRNFARVLNITRKEERKTSLNDGDMIDKSAESFVHFQA